ncbi:MAG: AraC family transcriptional regulator [Clostridiales bacterium]|nr:AraC family transcriptional regulator [Clostridiales bacterium]
MKYKVTYKVSSVESGDYTVGNCKIIKMIPKNNIYGNEVSDGFVTFKHWQQEIEFVYVEKGFLDIEIDNVLFNLQENELIIISSGALHSYIKSDNDAVIYVIRLLVDDIASYVDTKEEVLAFYRHTMTIETNKIIRDIIKSIIFANFGQYNDYYASVKAAELTIHLLLKPELIKQKILPEIVGESEVIMKMQEFIEDNLYKEITLGMLAEHLGFSKSYCSKFVKKNTKLNFLDYVKTIRLREAEELLRTTDLSITEVAYSTGFPSIQSFNRNFKASKGMNPTSYRKSLRNKV